MEKENLRILYMGTPEISAKVLEDLILNGFNIIGVIAQMDKPVGRKKELVPVPTKIIAEKNNIPVFQPYKIRLDYKFVKELNPDVIVTLAYGQIVPQGLLDIPKFGCINLHGSLLPKYRGAAPIQRAIINGEKETGVTLMEMIDKMDAGRMYATEKVIISDDDNFSSLKDKISEAASKLILRELPNYIDGKLPGQLQDENLVTFADKILKEHEKLNLSDCKSFINWVRGLANEPGGFLYLNDKKLKILNAKYYDDKVEEIGKISSINKSMILSLSDGRIELLKVQLEGKSVTDGRSFINGHQNIISSFLK